MKPEKAEQSVFAEAWQNLSADLAKLLPKRLRGAKGKWKFALALAFCELAVFGAVAKLTYGWLTG